MSETPSNITVCSPQDIMYPFGKSVFEDPLVVYHGTSRIHAALIEQNGWSPKNIPYSMEDIEKVCAVFESIMFSGLPQNSLGGYTILKAFTLIGGQYPSPGKPASFAGSYWRARNYADNPGGETISALIKAADELAELVSSIDLLEKHIASLEAAFNNPGLAEDQSKVRLRGAIEKVLDRETLNRSLEEVEEITVKYRNATVSHYPVVFAVTVDPLWFQGRIPEDRWQSPIEATNERRLLEVRPKETIVIPPQSIVGRADYVNGVEYWLPIRPNPLGLPVPWLMTADQMQELWDRYRKVF